MRRALSLSSAASVALLVFASLFSHVLLGRALAASDGFYQGKRIRIIVGLTPGGAVDIRARLFARHLPRWIPGKPQIIVQNMPGAAGLVAANSALRASKPDGLTFLHFPSSTVMHAFLAPDTVHYDIREVPIIWAQPYTWLAAINPKTSQVGTVKDLPRAPVRLVVGGTGATSERSLRPKLAMELLGVDHTWVVGYGGSAALMAALDRGEIHLIEETQAGYTPLLEPRVKEGSLAILWQTGFVSPDGSFQRSPLVPDVPTLDELLPREKKRGATWEAYKVLVIPQAFQNAVGLHAGVPPDRVKILSQAFRSMIDDPSFREDYQRTLGTPADIYVGSEADTLVKARLKLLEDSQDGIRYLRDLLKKK